MPCYDIHNCPRAIVKSKQYVCDPMELTAKQTVFDDHILCCSDSYLLDRKCRPWGASSCRLVQIKIQKCQRAPHSIAVIDQKGPPACGLLLTSDHLRQTVQCYLASPGGSWHASRLNGVQCWTPVQAAKCSEVIYPSELMWGSVHSCRMAPIHFQLPYRRPCVEAFPHVCSPFCAT